MHIYRIFLAAKGSSNARGMFTQHPQNGVAKVHNLPYTPK